ncbi:AMP-binding protein [Methylobrevis albus]|uniref:3-methylmercaptopropionyl-CoA ligase n=1 Tax=Methylobrevis albus TaxID=2793297 RepID=A0A931I212_9HYPH|nr:AMP-binding protein [Methylobrevis albus]MBH0237486.1 AMP-binding protein [Methylobrevis albus]
MANRATGGRGGAKSTGDAADLAATRPWLAAYPAGTAAEIDLAALPTLPALIDAAVARFAARPATESFGKRLTYAEVGAAARAVQAWLEGQGLRPGDRVALMMPNVLAYLPVLFGVLRGGFTVVNVNPLYTPRELGVALADSGARVLVVLENFGHTAQAALPGTAVETVVVVSPGDLMGAKGLLVNFVSRRVKKAVPAFAIPGSVRLGRVLGAGRRRAPSAIAARPDDVAFLQYTGGTTGVAKAAMLTHCCVAANVMQCGAWLGPFLSDDRPPVIITALPLYHIFALTASALLMAHLGALQVMIANPRDIPALVKTMQGRPFSAIILVNTLANALLNHPDFKTIDFSKLELAVAGGMAVQAAVAERWKAVTGRPIVEGYGLSETSPVVCCNRPDIAAWNGAIGYPVPSTEISIRDADGRPVGAGEQGELCVRGPQVMAGYWRRPDETARTMTADGFLRTGDIAVMAPDGLVRIVDRLKDMILVSGFNVYPNEVEDVLAAHPGVLEVAVIGRPDPRCGEAVVAYVVRRDASTDAEALTAHARAGLTPYKIPREFIFVEALPKTNVGKILRRALREAPPVG